MKLNKRRLFRVFSTILVVIMLLTGKLQINILALNQENNGNYLEYHDQIDFDGLSLCVYNKNKLVVDVDNSLSTLKKVNAKKNKKKYDKYVTEHPEAVGNLKESVELGDNICAISYTTAPLVQVDDHFERVSKTNSNTSLSVNASAADKSATAQPSYAGNRNLTLSTSIVRRGSSNPYTYTARTYGTWNNSAVSGKNYPASGEDYVLQSCPNVTKSDSFSSTYNYKTNGSTKGIEGKNYFRREGENGWVKYAVDDDPVGMAQLQTFSLSQVFYANSTTTGKKICSYYVHTWKKVGISVTASGQAGMSGKNPTASVGLSLTPSVKDVSWQVYNYVYFDW